MSRPGLTQERLVALFLLGLVLFTPPFLGIFNTANRILGVPTLYLYLFTAWTVLIVLVTFVIESSRRGGSTDKHRRAASRRLRGNARADEALRSRHAQRADDRHHRVPLLCLLFAIAYYGDKRADRGQSIIANPYIYALSIAVYCTAWTFYGSVGRAASSGVGFLPIYIGPTLAFILGWYLIRKIIRISKVNRITSIADFIASRYGKSSYLGGLVTIIAVVGIMPYISLQLKAISMSFSVLLGYPEIVMPAQSGSTPVLQDTALYVALIMAAFAILFGTRHIDASEHHEGMVAAIAFELVVKLLAFLAVGVFVTYRRLSGFRRSVRARRRLRRLVKLFTIEAGGGYTTWISLTMLAMLAIVVLPRQFQVLVVENVDERHVKKAVWLFPLYLLLINIFVLPIAFGGLLHFPQGQRRRRHFRAGPADGRASADDRAACIHRRPFRSYRHDHRRDHGARHHGVERSRHADAAAFGRLHLSERRDLTGVLLAIRRGAIVVIVLLGYAYVRLIGETYALVTIGLVSFVAAAQFAPAIIGGIVWTGATKAGRSPDSPAGSWSGSTRCCCRHSRARAGSAKLRE